jgi:hypothetical protein
MDEIKKLHTQYLLKNDITNISFFDFLNFCKSKSVMLLVNKRHYHDVYIEALKQSKSGNSIKNLSIKKSKQLSTSAESLINNYNVSV